MVALSTIQAHLDLLFRTPEIADYDEALNGVQLAHGGPVQRVATAVDLSLTTVRAAVAGGANLLIVHHGMFWGGPRALTGPLYERLRLLVEHDIAVYSLHLPLDLHAQLGNNALLAHELGLVPEHGFGQFRGTPIGCGGMADVATSDLHQRADTFARSHGGSAACTPLEPGRRTRHWAMVTGAGASTATLREAADAGVDTLIVGEGPHHTAVDAIERDIAVIYAGHYATETLGVQAMAMELERAFALPWFFVNAPTGL